MENILEFDALAARKRFASTTSEKLSEILMQIYEISKDEQRLPIYESLTTGVLEALETKGFEVIRHPSIAVQKDSLYYTIKW
jgi:hypothetical protein